MKKFSVIILAAAMGLLASCVKESPNELLGGASSLEVSIASKSNLPENPTRTHMGPVEGGKRKVYWSNGDAICVNGSASDKLSDLPADAVKANFKFETPVSAPYNIVYPASIYEDATHVTLPANQDFSSDGFAEGMFPMAGYSADGSAIAIHHLCAVLRLNLKRSSAAAADEDPLMTVSFKGGHDEQVSGSFTLDYEHATLTGSSTDDKDLKVSTSKKQATSTETVISYCLVVPAGSYQEGFTFEIVDENADKMVIDIDGSTCNELEAGRFYDINASGVVYTPNDVETGIEISTAEELVAFATAYNNNEYLSLGQYLIATLTADITFDETTSAAFIATKGMGTDDDGKGGTNHFNGIFNGNNHKISGLVSTVPLFFKMGTNGKVKDLTLDNTCSFTFTHDNAAEGMFGAIAGYHKGKIDNVKVAADVTLAEKTGVTQMTSLGGLVGYANGGKILNGSEYSGLVSTPAGFVTTGKLIIGGLAGRIKTASASISDSYFKGAISNEAQVTTEDATNPYLIIGGVVGFVDGGASVSASHSTADHADVESAYTASEFKGKIVNKTSVAYHSAQGSIVGELNNGSVSNCTNAATIACTVFRASDNCRYMKSGGIVGKVNANGTVTDCTNNGTVQHRSNPKYQDLGGIAGYNAGKITGCTNTAAVNQMTSGQSIKAGRYVYLGGVIGENVADNKVSDVHNTANIEISSMENNANSEERMGGVVGSNKGALVGGETKDITNSGQVYHSPVFDKQFAGYYIGGIVGFTEASVKNAKNVGRVNFRWNATTALSKVHIGGIAGKASDESSTIENCENTVDAGITNSAQVYLYLPGNASYSDNYVGGIVGLTEATNPVKNCTNGGEVRTAAGVSTVPVTDIKMGGIIGKMTGSGTVDNADNSGRVRINFAVVAATGESHHGNYLGGIIGHITNDAAVTVTGCDNSGPVDITNGAGLVQDHIASGVVGRMDAPGSITNCKNNGGAIQMLITKNAVGPKDLYCAGVLGYSESDVTLSGCSNTGALTGGNATAVPGTAFYMGGVVAYLKGSSKILDCSNTGSVVNSHAGNNDTIGSTSLTGGLAGYVEGTELNPVEIGGETGCTVNTSASLNATRGWVAGVAAYAKYAQISKCTVQNDIDAAARGAGGIVGKAEYCTISACYFNGDKVKANQIQPATGLGGIVGNLDNSTIDGCYCYATKFYNSNSQPFGGIVGISVSNNTIQNCHYKLNVEGPTASTAATAVIVATGDYTDGGGNAADLDL